MYSITERGGRSKGSGGGGETTAGERANHAAEPAGAHGEEEGEHYQSSCIRHTLSAHISLFTLRVSSPK